MATSEAAALNEQLGIMDPNADISGKIKASTAAGFAIATIAIILRFFCRWVCRKSFMLNDYLILAAYPFKLAIDVASICCEYSPFPQSISRTTRHQQPVRSFYASNCII